MPAKSSSKVSGKKSGHKFVIDCTQPANDRIFDTAQYEKFLHDRIKVEGRTGQLGDKITIKKEGEGKLVVESSIPFSKRYIKYLTKKFLKKSALRDWLRVVSTGKNVYTLKFFNLAYDQDANEDDE